MRLHVAVEGGLDGEGTATHLAGEGLLAGVDAGVAQQVARLLEALVAEVALVGVSGHAGGLLHVLLQRPNATAVTRYGQF